MVQPHHRGRSGMAFRVHHSVYAVFDLLCWILSAASLTSGPESERLSGALAVGTVSDSNTSKSRHGSRP